MPTGHTNISAHALMATPNGAASAFALAVAAPQRGNCWGSRSPAGSVARTARLGEVGLRGQRPGPPPGENRILREAYLSGRLARAPGFCAAKIREDERTKCGFPLGEEVRQMTRRRGPLSQKGISGVQPEKPARRAVQADWRALPYSSQPAG